MVLAQRVGQPRSFWAGFFLTLVTFGVYAVYWNYKAHNEVYRQFELARENRDEGMVWYVLGLVVPPFLLAYFWVMASNVTYVRDRIGLPRRQTPGRFVGIIGVGAGAFFLGVIVVEAAIVAAGEDEAAVEDALLETLPVFLVCLGTTAILLPIAYHGLQRDINEVWQAYDARLAYLRTVPPATLAAPTPPGYGQPQGALPPPHAQTRTLFERVAPGSHPSQPRPDGGYSYYADLQPTAATPPPPRANPYLVPPPPPTPLQLEWENLKAQNPGLVHPDVETLLASAAAGDPYAHERAAVLLRQSKGLADDRRGLLMRREALLQSLQTLDERLASGDLGVSAHEVERSMVERDLAMVRERLAAVEARLFGRV